MCFNTVINQLFAKLNVSKIRVLLELL
jgi:hypothetical protein